MTARLLLLLLGLVPLCLSAQTLYKYVDDAGQVHYTDRPPADAASEEMDIQVDSLLGPAEISARRADYAARLQNVASGRVVIFTTDWCRVCKKAKRYMDDNSIAYSERDIEKSDSARRDYERLGGKGVPLLQVGQQTMHGFDAGSLDRLLARQ